MIRTKDQARDGTANGAQQVEDTASTDTSRTDVVGAAKTYTFVLLTGLRTGEGGRTLIPAGTEIELTMADAAKLPSAAIRRKVQS